MLVRILQRLETDGGEDRLARGAIGAAGIGLVAGVGACRADGRLGGAGGPGTAGVTGVGGARRQEGIVGSAQGLDRIGHARRLRGREMPPRRGSNATHDHHGYQQADNYLLAGTPSILLSNIGTIRPFVTLGLGKLHCHLASFTSPH